MRHPSCLCPALLAPLTIATPALAAEGLPDKGDTTWMLLATMIVLLMIVPGLALFYSGMVRAKNALSILTQVTAITCIACLLWVCGGYSIAFTEGNVVAGGLSRLFLRGVGPESMVATFSEGVVIPEFVFIGFQMMFAAISTALIVGGLAERARFGGILLFSALWLLLVYAPLAHMVWWPGGLVNAMGALDFAGGTVVHINAGVAALVGVLFLGRRQGFPHEPMPPHAMTMTMIGTGLLWFGWFAFNAGSNLEANGTTALALVNTFLAPAAAGPVWMGLEWAGRGKPSLLGLCSGIIAGLVAVTPAAGSVGPMGAIAIGAAGSLAAYAFITRAKPALGLDDSLDAFGIHGIAGIAGSILTGVFTAAALGGTGAEPYAMGHQVWVQTVAVAIAIAWSGLGSALLFLIVERTVGLRVSREVEMEGLDITVHGERAFHP